MKIVVAFFVAISLQTFAGGISSGTMPSLNNPPEVWGGQHIELTITPQKTWVKLDCAWGEIQEPWDTQQKSFSFLGTIIMGGGIGFSPETEALYRGRIHNNRMSLIVSANGVTEKFVLQKNQTGSVYPCLKP